MNYIDFIKNKGRTTEASGFSVDRSKLHGSLFPHQRDITAWALRKGKAAVFAGTGLGKTRIQIEWAHQIHMHTGGDILLLVPLTVAAQTVAEARAMGYEINLCEDQGDVNSGLNITNYEKLHHFEPICFDGVVLDESSILKSFTGKVRTDLIQSFIDTPFRLACTATPAPNDYMEIGNHAEFLGVMKRNEMLSMYFTHDSGNTSKWRLKHYADSDFWRWVAGWAVVLENPSDLGYSDDGYNLPPLTVDDLVIDVDGELAITLSQRQRARRETIADRVAACAEIANASEEPFLIWCDLNAESEALKAAIPGSEEVKGSDKPQIKAQRLKAFSNGSLRVLITKPSIAGFGMNWQHCHNMAFVGLSDSFEQVFQAIRRCWRFGQENPVNVTMITTTREGASAENIKRKEADFHHMVAEMVKYTKEITSKAVRSTARDATDYDAEEVMKIPQWIGGEPYENNRSEDYTGICNVSR